MRRLGFGFFSWVFVCVCFFGGLAWFGLCCLVTPGLSKETKDHNFSRLANHPTRHQATHKVGCQPGDCIWSLQSSSGVCVGMYGLTYGLTYSLYHP